MCLLCHQSDVPSELIALLNPLYNLLPQPAASSALSEALSESVFKFGKGTKVLTEPLILWISGPAGQSLIASTDGGGLVLRFQWSELMQANRAIR